MKNLKLAIVGLGWGDEGKAKIGDFILTRNYGLNEGIYSLSARYSGGPNAGHTQWFGNENVITHGVPIGITHENVYNAILAGVLTDPITLLTEIEDVIDKGYPVTPDNLGISGYAQVILPYHKEIERMMEEARGTGRIGSTMRGMSPASITKVGKMGIRFAEFCGKGFPVVLAETLGYINNVFGTAV